jgi:hypothetical protein
VETAKEVVVRILANIIAIIVAAYMVHTLIGLPGLP